MGLKRREPAEAEFGGGVGAGGETRAVGSNAPGRGLAAGVVEARGANAVGIAPAKAAEDCNRNLMTEQSAGHMGDPGRARGGELFSRSGGVGKL